MNISKYRERIENIPQGSLSNDLERYNLAKKATKAANKYYARIAKQVQKGKKSEDELKAAEYILEESQGTESYEKRKLRDYHGVNPDEIRTLVRKGASTLGWATAASAAIVVSAAAIFGGVSWWNTNSYKNNALSKQEAILRYVANPDKFDRQDLERLDEDSKELSGLVANLVKVDYPEFHANADKIKFYGTAIKKLFEEKSKFEDAKRLAAQGDPVAALGRKINITGIRENLPESWHKPFDKFEAEYEIFKKENEHYEFVLRQIESTNRTVEDFDKEFKSLEAILDNGELFDKERADILINSLRNSLSQLSAFKIEGTSKENVEKLKERLKNLEESLGGKTSLLTKYARLQFKKLEKDLSQIQTSLDELKEQDYLIDKPEETAEKLNSSLQSIREYAQSIENSRLEDPWTLFSKISAQSDNIAAAKKELDSISALKKSAESGDLEALVKLVEIYAEHDLDDGKWDGDAVRYLEKIPQNQRKPVESIANIADLESRLARKEGFVKITSEGLMEENVRDYESAVKGYLTNKVVRPIKEAIENLAGKISVKEGEIAKNLVSELNELQSQIVEIELGKTKTEEEKQKASLKLKELKEAFAEKERKMMNAAAILGDAAKNAVEKGELTPPLEDMINLAKLYMVVNETDVANNCIQKAEDIRKKLAGSPKNR